MTEASHDEITGFVEYIRRKGVTLWVHDDQLHFTCAKGTLNAMDVAKLKNFKGRLLQILKGATTNGLLDRDVDAGISYAPLSFSQLAQWSRDGLASRPGVRSVVSTTRLLGQLNLDALHEGVREVVRRHQALRTVIVLRDGEPLQEIHGIPQNSLLTEVVVPAGQSPLEFTLQLLEQLVLSPVDIAVGPLFTCQLVKLSDDERVLIMTMEHIISDNVSKNIVLHDILSAYAQLSRCEPVHWSGKAMQFQDYARPQRSGHESWLEEHGTYWETHMHGCMRTPFPASPSIPSRPDVGWGTAPIEIDKRREIQLREWCRANNTTMPMAAFTAYVAVVLRWCNVAETVVQFETDGRSIAGAERAVGSFAATLGLRVRLFASDDFLTLLERVTHEFCAAYEHHDFSYLAAQSPPPSWTHNSVFNWMPAATEFNAPESDTASTPMRASPVEFPNPWLENLTWDNEPTTALYEGPAGITGSVHFARGEHSDADMAGFVMAFLLYLERMLDHPQTRIQTIPLPEIQEQLCVEPRKESVR
jgi:hypothetical protein